LACWLSVLLLQKSSVVFCTCMHEIDKIEYSRGSSVNFCEYSILIFYLVVFFSSGRPMVIFSLACLVVKNILSFGQSLYIPRDQLETYAKSIQINPNHAINPDLITARKPSLGEVTHFCWLCAVRRQNPGARCHCLFV